MRFTGLTRMAPGGSIGRNFKRLWPHLGLTNKKWIQTSSNSCWWTLLRTNVLARTSLHCRQINWGFGSRRKQEWVRTLFFFTLFFFTPAEYRRQITEGPPDQLRVWKQTEARMGTHSLCFRAFFLWTYSFFFLALSGGLLCTASVAPCEPERIGCQVADPNHICCCRITSREDHRRWKGVL